MVDQRTASQEAQDAGDRLVSEHLPEDPFAAAFKATRMPMIITDPRQPDNPIIFCNKAFNLLTGTGTTNSSAETVVFCRDPRQIEKRSPNLETRLHRLRTLQSIFSTTERMDRLSGMRCS